ncbi:MAG: hypothetical protein ACLVD8_25910 [Enterocloster sp.]|uniref:hypothetical protein n=1 Tax=Enterocloster sp. TaxID=2719315 RepID=UPI003999CA6C
MNACIWHFAGSQIMFLTSTTRITADGENSKTLMIRSHYGLKPKIRLTACGIFSSSAELCCGPQSLTARPKLCNATIHRRKEDMATNLLSFYQGELPVYPPWSEDRRRQSDTRHENPLSRLSKKLRKSASRQERKSNLKKGGLDNETAALPQGAVGSSLVQRQKLYADGDAADPPKCLRCGAPLAPHLMVNALSRYVDVQICEACGMDEALRDAAHVPLSLEEWDAIKQGRLLRPQKVVTAI